ncbi:conserved membrane hypothetical protein [Burkholderia sp. 8Y]|uniref:hypothetical protein n=1 Tax=Burkholderia sp. 8Y TaxID=2653133 RepID=UPI0012F31188|nr:hypothetical protein [Burkholderia sp. 8Y]VXC34518.1 conserved membrane hypothetical protein [Burkholderia sp. 8Y]
MLILAPLVVKLPALIGALVADPTLLYAQLQSYLHPGPIRGYPPYPTIDPNIGYTSHALGRRAALDLLSGDLPWWNHFEGVGAPLAGEMQSAAFFPLTWLMVLHDGQLYLHLILQIIAGVSTWALLRRLTLPTIAALAGSLAFEFNGSFAWLANAAINPIPFLPLTLLGIETLHDRAATRTGGGWASITIGLAASLYAGFPEVAYLDGLLVLAWTLVRTASLPRNVRFHFLLGVCLAGTIALCIAAPILVAFFDYLPLAHTGSHDAGDGFASSNIGCEFLLALLSPYAFGGIFQDKSFAAFWGVVGGYAGCTLVALALCGVSGSTHRGLRIALALWVAVSLGMSYGFPGMSALVHIIPGLKLAAYFRYLPPSWEFCLCVLAAFGLAHLQTETHVARFKGATVAIVLMCGLTFWMMIRANLLPQGRFAQIAWLVTAIVLLANAAFAWGTRSARVRSRALASLLVAEAVIYLLVPVLSLPSRGTVELGGVRFLQANLGQHRFTTLGPVQPNYGSYFGIAEVNHNDLPVPKAWTDYIVKHLDPNASPILFTGVSRADPAGPSAVESLLTHLEGYRRIGTRYVVAPANALGSPSFAPLQAYLQSPTGPRLSLVYSDKGMQFLEIADPAPYLSAAGCSLVVESRDALEADCSASSKLIRLELFMPGWQAWINGSAQKVGPTGEIFQEVALPKGRSTIRFAFSPPFIGWAYALFGAGWAVLIIALIPIRRSMTRKTADANARVERA